MATAYEESQKHESPETTALLASVKLLKMLAGTESSHRLAMQVRPSQSPVLGAEDSLDERIAAVRREMMEVYEAGKAEMMAEVASIQEILTSIQASLQGR